MVAETLIKSVVVPEAPAIHGLRFRLFAGDADFARMAAVIQAAKVVDQVERIDSEDDLRRSYSHLTHCDPFQDLLVAEIAGEMAGYSRTTWYVDLLSQERIYMSFGFIKPEWRHKGFGRAMLHWNQEHLRQIAAEHPQSGPRFFESHSREHEASAAALLTHDGYLPARHFNLMVRPDLENIPNLALPAGLEVRPVRPEQYRQVWEASCEAFRDHWGFDPEAESYESWLDQRNQQPDLWQVAWAGDEVAGMVLSYIDTLENQEYRRRRGWTENICVRRPWRGQGLARALIARSLSMLKELDMAQACLGVDSQNLSGALRLYESMGYQTVERSTNWRKAM